MKRFFCAPEILEASAEHINAQIFALIIIRLDFLLLNQGKPQQILVKCEHFTRCL